MMQKTRKNRLLTSLLCAALAAAMVTPSLAAAVSRTISVYTGVKVYVDDVQIDAGDTHGNPDAFIYNGTTYVAVAAVSNSLGEDVKWEGDTKSVYIGKHEGSSSYLLNVCPPYQKQGAHYDRTTVKMAGKTYSNIFEINGYALFNLNGKYDTLSFDFGHVDGESMKANGEYHIYLDGELVLSAELDPEAMPKHYTIPLNGAIQMKIVGKSSAFALANVQVT